MAGKESKVGNRLAGNLTYMQEWHLCRRKKAEADGKCTVCCKRKPTKGMKSCPKCREYQKKYRRENEDKVRGQTKEKLLRRYGLTLEQYDRMHKVQKHKCAICGRKMKLCVDHCHETGKVRELLCLPCNVLVGQFENHPERVEKTIEYIRKHSQ